VGQNFQTVAEIEAERVGNALEQQINALTFLIRQEPDLADGLVRANDSYPDSETESRRLLQEQEQQWQTSAESDPFILQYRSNPQSLALSRFRGATIFHDNVFLTDRRGGLVAAQGERPARFYYGDEPWWQTAWSNGQGDVYLGRLTFDPETKIASILIAVGLVNPKTNQTIGVIASTTDLRSIQRDLSLARPQTTGEATLLTSDGTVIAGPDEQTIGQSAWPNLLNLDILPAAAEGSEFTEPGWLLDTDRQNNPAVLAHAPLVTTSGAKINPLRSLGWQIVVSNTQDNALAGVTRSTKIASLVGVLTMAVVVLAAIAMARVITRPIEALTMTAAAISEGDLERQAEPVGLVELVTLAEAFNTLTTRLRTLINSLQDQVAERTAQLETLFKQERQQRQIAESLRQVATILNTSLDRDIVLAKIMEQLGGVIRYNGASIFLQEGDDLVITRGAVLADKYLGYRISLASADPTIRVFKQRQPLIIADVQLDPHWEVWEAGASIRSWMGAPLLTGEHAIGVLTVDNFESGAYSEEDAQVLQIFANQAATAIENARLYTEAHEARVAAEVANRDLFEALKNLQTTQSQLVEAEKMAALGGLVAGVAHEINTPVGIGVTAASLLEDKTVAFRSLFQNGQMKRSDLEKYLDTAGQSSNMILKNLQRAAELIHSFKQVAVDQSSEERRSFAVKAYLDEILLSLHPKLKRTQLITEIRADENLTLDSYPGVFAQIVTNLVMNSLVHAYEPGQAGKLSFDLKQKKERFIFEYGDDGRGIPAEHMSKIFDPFFTTKRGQGGSGLGLHIIYNLVTQKLGGTIRCESEVGRGTRFIIELPMSIKSEK
jgi:signal transduction histidine kinase/HAMP domain-containing protein